MSNTRKRNKLRNRQKQPPKATPKDRHVAAIQQEADRLRDLTPVGTRRIGASFQSYRRLTNLLGWLVDAVDPTAAGGVDTQRVLVTQSPTNSDGIHQAARAVDGFVRIKDWIDTELTSITRQLEDKIEAGDFDRWKPEPQRCFKNHPTIRGEKCPMYARHQAWDLETCSGCERPFGRT